MTATPTDPRFTKFVPEPLSAAVHRFEDTKVSR